MLLNKPVIIGIAGGSASGKTTIAQKIIDTFKDTNSIGIIKEDDYYKDQSNLSFEDRKKTNYDHPLAFDHELMRFQIQELIAGRIVEKPTYDYTVHNRSDKTEIVEPKDVIIIEGLFVLEEKEIRDLLDIKVLWIHLMIFVLLEDLLGISMKEEEISIISLINGVLLLGLCMMNLLSLLRNMLMLLFLRVAVIRLVLTY